MITDRELAEIMISIPRSCTNCFMQQIDDIYSYCYDCYHGDKWVLSNDSAMTIAEKILNKIEEAK